jgi:hypothetical protein
MPNPFNQRFVVDHSIPQLAQCARIVTIAISQVNDRRQPEFGFTNGTSHMNMDGFA